MEFQKREHVILFPFLAKGHIVSYLALAQEIEKKRAGCQVTLISTPLNLKQLTTSLSPSSSIRLCKIPFNGSDHGIPTHVESLENLPPQLGLQFLEATASLKQSFRAAVTDIMDDQYGSYIVADIFYGWTTEIARELGIFHAIYAGYSAFGLAFYYSLTTALPCLKVDDATELISHDFVEGGTIHVAQIPALAASDGTDPFSVLHRETLLGWHDTDGILFNTVEEIDKQGIGYFQRKLGSKVYTIGPITTKIVRVSSDNECLKWLDAKPQKSVLYVCFGSQNTLTASQMLQLAIALEASKVAFVWVVRPPLGIEPNTEFRADEWLPMGFEERTADSEMGILVKGWAPQMEILSHKAVGGFISHCGWNSVLEAISHSVPILGWPISAEQPFNAMLLEVLGIGVELVRGNTCEVNNEHLAAKIKMLMGANVDSERLRNRSCEVRKMFEDAKEDGISQKGSSVRSMEEFFKAAVSYRSSKNKGNNFTS